MRINPTKLIYGAVFFTSVFLSACGGGGAAAPAPATTYTIGGTVAGLTGTGLVLQNNGGDNLSIINNGSFVFATPLASGATYAVTVKTQPSGQFCSVNPLSGTVAAAKITTVAVTCASSANTYTIGGNVTGLTGAGLVLQNNGGDNLPITASGSFVFASPLASGSTYAVTVQTQPSGQTCSVNPLSGTVAAANITTVAVTCASSANTYTIGGTISGLTGAGLVLQNNGGDNYSVSAGATTFIFSTALVSGTGYTVTVQTQPAGQTCTVDAPTNTGTVATANITNVAVTCTTVTNAYTIGGTVTGLTGNGLILQNNGGDDLSITAPGGNFVFATTQANSSLYVVTVLAQPSGQTCSVTSGGVGLVPGANVTAVAVTCSANTYTIGGSITGLTATGLVLQNNGGDDLIVSSGATTYTFITPIANGAAYTVTVLTQPSGQTCTVNVPTNTGTVSAANVTNVSVACSVNTYTIGGTITGLTGAGLVLQNNGGDDLTPAASVYTFTTPLAYNSTYNVTVLTQPTAPAQICTVNASGTVTAAVTNANVTCVNAYTIGGSISGDASLGAGIGPILQNNGGDNLFIPTLPASGVPVTFTFSTPIFDGAPYSVTQLARARAPSQDCSAGTPVTGNVGGIDVTTVSITCVSSPVVPKFAYVTNSTANPALGVADTVSAFTVAASGVLAASTTPTTASGDQPYAVAVDPTGQFAYVVNSNADSVSAYGVAGNGDLTVIDADGATIGAQSSIPTGDNPKSIAVDASGKFVYVANQGNGISTGNTLSAYSIDIASGALSAIDADAVTPLTQSTIATGTFPYAVTVDPLGKFAYVANYNSNDVSVYTIDQTSGALTPVGTAVAAGTGPSSIATDPTGKCALVANNTSNDVMSYAIDPTTGALTLVTTTTAIASSAPRSVAIDPDTGLYAYVANAGGSVSAFSVTLATCAIAEIDADAGAGGPTIAAGSTPLSINVDPSGQFVYVANFASDSVSVYSIGVGGALTLVQTQTTGLGPTSVTTTQ